MSDKPKHEAMRERAANGSRAAAIRLFCIECQGGSLPGVKACAAFQCFLWPYRMGRGSQVRRQGSGGDGES